MTQKKPIITVKNVQYNERLSTDSLCFSATVYVDGKRFAVATDDGNGGEVNIDPYDRKGWEGFNDRYKELSERIRDTYPKHVSKMKVDGENLAWDETIETLVNDAVIVYLGKRDYNKALKKTLFIVGDDMRTLNTPHDQGNINWIKNKYPDAIILNEMDYDEGFKLFIGKEV